MKAIRMHQTGGPIGAHLLISGFTHTGFAGRRGVTEKPAGAWTAGQVAVSLLDGMAQGDFYILYPDHDVTREMDEKRIAWAAGDIFHNRHRECRHHHVLGARFHDTHRTRRSRSDAGDDCREATS
jgi:hypothetical protein